MRDSRAAPRSQVTSAMANLDSPFQHEPLINVPRGGVGVYDRPSWVRKHILALVAVLALALTLFAMYAINTR